MMNKKTLTYMAVALVSIVGIASFLDDLNNNGTWYGSEDYTHVIQTDSTIQKNIETACLDCHSNFTNPVWYDNLVPVSFLIKYHVDEGKHELNFSEFARYSLKKQKHKLHEIAEQLDAAEMPMESYILMHPAAALSPSQRQAIVHWSKNAIQQLEQKAAQKNQY